MDAYKSDRNITALCIACDKMLKDKFNVSYSDENIKELISDVALNIISNSMMASKSLNELNNITLSNIRNTHQNHHNSYKQPETMRSTSQGNNGSNGSNTETLDDDLISSKLKELEIRRQIIPAFSDTEQVYSPKSTQSMHTTPILKPNPISITIPPTIENKKRYKTFIINSINRDWEKNPQRNNIKFNITLDISNNVVFPQCICFPKFVKKLSPYIFMNICDGVSNIYISFTCSSSSPENKWDIWTPVEDVEHITLNNKTWLIRFFDFTNNEIDLGIDGQNVSQVTKDGNKFQLSLSQTDNKYDVGDLIKIKTYDGKYVIKKIIQCTEDENTIITISDDIQELQIDHFINSKIMNLSNQFSFIVKYYYKN